MTVNPRISAIIITKNEEKNIGRCIDSLQSLADEILVVDSYSEDKTREIVLEKGVCFMEHPFEGYSQQKNWAIEQASYPHILSIDADEIPDEQLKSEILRVKAHWDADGYSFNRLNNYCGKWLKHGGWYPDKKLRLWDSRKGKWVGDLIHETLQMEPGTQVRQLNGNLLHYSFHTISQHLEQLKKYTDLGARADYAKGRKSHLLKILVLPAWKFFRDFILRLGFLDGYYGYMACRLSAYAKYLKFVKLREIHRNAQK